MTLVHAPQRKHSCDIGWELVPWPEDANPSPPPGYTHKYEMVHWDDDPGTVRQCPVCGKTWVAVKNRPGMAGVYWRRERWLERRVRTRGRRRDLLD